MARKVEERGVARPKQGYPTDTPASSQMKEYKNGGGDQIN